MIGPAGVGRAEDLWSIGAVSRATGLGEHTLRAWERRFGFPAPRRLSSGHRRYTAEQVDRLRLIARALELGHRAGTVVPMGPEKLRALIGESLPAAGPLEGWLESTLEQVRQRDRAALLARLERDLTALGMLRMIEDRLVPLMAEVGRLWAQGELDVGHEHFFTQVVDDLLRDVRRTLEMEVRGTPVVLTTLPGEQHGIGLQLAAVVIELAGRSVHLLGVETPPEAVAIAVRDLDAPAVGVSVSVSGATREVGDQLTELRRRLPNDVQLWLGGGGADRLDTVPRGVKVIPRLREIAPLVALL